MGSQYDLHGQDLKKERSWTGYVLNVTSQRWLTDADFSPDSTAKSIWWHMLVGRLFHSMYLLHIVIIHSYSYCS